MENEYQPWIWGIAIILGLYELIKDGPGDKQNRHSARERLNYLYRNHAKFQPDPSETRSDNAPKRDGD